MHSVWVCLHCQLHVWNLCMSNLYSESWLSAMSSALCSNMYCVLNMGRSLINPLECQVLYPLRSVTFAWTSVISVDFHDCRFTAEEVWFKWFWIIQSSSSDQFLLQLLQGIYLILIFWIAIPNLLAYYSLIYLDFSIVLSIALELNWSFLGLYCDIKVCNFETVSIIYCVAQISCLGTVFPVSI